MADDLSESIEAYVGGNVLPLPTLADRVRANMPVAMEAKPDYEADLQKAARVTGVPLPSARNYPNEVTARAKSNAFDYEAMAEETPAMASLFADLDKARIAHDDVPQLGAIERTLSVLKNSGSAFVQGLYTTSAGAVGLAQMAADTPFSGAYRRRFGREAPLNSFIIDYRREIEATAESWKPKTDNPYSAAFYSGIQSIPGSVGAAALGLMGNPFAGTALLGATTAGQSYAQARDQGIDPTTARVFGASQGLIEYATEMLPMSKLVGDIAAGTPFVKTLAKNLALEMPGEQVATILQDMNEWAILNPEKPFTEYLKERPSAAVQTAIATTVGTTGQVTLAKGVNKAIEVIDRRREKANAAADLEKLGEVEQTAAQSKLRVRDPDAFREFLSKQTDGTPVEKLFIPAEKVVEYYQSQGMDWQSSSDFDFQTDFDDQMQQALATGGDIVVDTAGALTDLSGTDIWEALKPNARLSVDGMSIAEAQDFEAGRADELAKMDAEMSAQMEADRKAMEPRQRVFEDARDQLMRSGMTPDVAATNAELLASRYATRAERLGTDIESEYAKSGLQVRQVLPEGLAPIVAADQLDMAIAAMKKRKGERSDSQKFGPSLAEFIAKRGGIEDRGGDLASRGANEWHKGKPGRRKLIRPHDDTGTFAGMKADNANTPDALAMAAWEAGYFPNLPERPTVNDLLDALDQELSGRPIYAADNTTQNDELLAAASELERLLEQRGLDPAKATPKQIRDVVNEYQQEAEGRGFDQVDPKSAAFKAWFGDSKVVDDKGEPLIVFHGTASDFDAFSKDADAKHIDLPGFYFTPDASVAERFAESASRRPFRDADGYIEGFEGANIAPVYLSIRNPAQLNLNDAESGTMSRASDVRALLERARKDGHDGAIIRGWRDGSGEVQYVAFEPTQIKSTFNRGTFDPNDARILYQPAFHGSPHVFDKFSLDAIGTGEGAQAYGWGLYFAGRKEIAEHYRKTLAGEKFTTATGGVWSPDDLRHVNVRATARKNGADLDATLSRAAELLAGANDQTRPLLEADIAELTALKEAGGVKPAAGRLYEVEIPEDNEYLLWDAPLSEQPGDVWDRVIDAVQRGMGDPMGEELAAILELGDLTGKDAYNWIAGTFERGAVPEGVHQTPSGRSARMASEILHDAGVAGVKYLDGGSRSAGDGSYNYVVFDDSRVSIRAYEQSFADGPRGRIVFPAGGYGSGPSVIELFEARNLSTFIHESGHLFLEELRQDSSDPAAPQQLRDDWAAIEKWFASEGVPVVDGVIPTEAHELWARGWERYTMEGKSPSSVLRKAFDAFKSWLLNIYQVVNNLKAPITPEIREVMDRLIATDEEIADARERQGLKALFSTAQEAGMSDVAFAEYQKAASESLDEAHDALLYRVMAEIRKRRTKEWKEQEASVRADVTAQVHARPEFKALHLLRTGKILGDPESPVRKVKLDRQWLVDTYGQDALGLLPKGAIYADTGTTDADLIAEMTGFRTGDEMVRTLMAVEARKQEMVGDKRSVMNALIDEETAQVMRDRYGDPLSDGSIETEALAAVHNEKQGEVIAAEIRSLAQRAGRKPTPYQIAREWAKERVAASRVVDSTSRSAIQRYARAAAKAGKEAEAAMLKGDAEETLRQKQRQMLNNALVAEASKAADEVDAAVARLGKLAKRPTIKSIDQDHLDQVHQLLERYEFRQVSQTALNERESFEVWAAAQQAAGYDVISPDRLAAGKINWSRMTVEELKGLDEAVKQIVHLGRLKQKLLDAKDEREFNEVVDEGVASAGMLPPKPPSDLMEPSYWDSIKSRVADMDASLLKMETVFDWLDNKDPNGVFNRVVFRRIADAQDREKAMIQDYITRLTDHLKAIPKKQLARWSEKVSAPELINRETSNPWVFTREQLISIALNMGNEGNIQRLTDGYGWSEAGVMSALNRELTAEDWAYVQNVWDTIGTLWPEIAAMEKRLNGVEPEKVEAKPFETAHGSMKGGYFPAIYDPRKSLEAEAQAAKGSDLFENIYTRANTRAGATQNRADKVSRPIHLSLGVINRHITEVIHDITHREAIMDADRFLSDRRIMKAVDETLGPEVRKQFRPWLQHIANEYALDRRGVAGWDAFAKKLRSNTSLVGMGFRLSTIILQVAGYSNSFERVGAKWVAPQLWKAFDPRAWAFVLERSNEVRNRMDTMERDIRENVKAVLGKHDLLSEARRFAFYGIGYMDRAVTIPTWLGAYNRGTSEGMSDADAVYFADKAVRQSQGAGAAKDLAAVQRSNEWMRLATMFYSYQAAVYQRFRTLGRDVRRTQDLPDLIARSFWLVVVPPLLSELLAGRGPDEDEDWGMWAFQNMLVGLLGPIPIVRDVAGAMESGFGYSFTPAARAFETGMNVVKDIKKIAAGEETKRATRNALEVSGYALGLPTGQLASAVQFIVDVSEGEQDPQTLGDWYTGLSKGKLPEE